MKVTKNQVRNFIKHMSYISCSKVNISALMRLYEQVDDVPYPAVAMGLFIVGKRCNYGSEAQKLAAVRLAADVYRLCNTDTSTYDKAYEAIMAVADNHPSEIVENYWDPMSISLAQTWGSFTSAKNGLDPHPPVGVVYLPNSREAYTYVTAAMLKDGKTF